MPMQLPRLVPHPPSITIELLTEANAGPRILFFHQSSTFVLEVFFLSLFSRQPVPMAVNDTNESSLVLEVLEFLCKISVDELKLCKTELMEALRKLRQHLEDSTSISDNPSPQKPPSTSNHSPPVQTAYYGFPLHRNAQDLSPSRKGVCSPFIQANPLS